MEGGQWAANPKSQIPNHPILFSVRTPTAVVTDLGTEFGVEVDRSGATQSHVFRGRIEMCSSRSRLPGGTLAGAARPTVERADRLPGTTSRPAGGTYLADAPIILTAGESARAEPNGDRTVRVIRQPGQPQLFVRQIPRRTPIKLFNTGVGLEAGRRRSALAGRRRQRLLPGSSPNRPRCWPSRPTPNTCATSRGGRSGSICAPMVSTTASSTRSARRSSLRIGAGHGRPARPAHRRRSRKGHSHQWKIRAAAGTRRRRPAGLLQTVFGQRGVHRRRQRLGVRLVFQMARQAHRVGCADGLTMLRIELSGYYVRQKGDQNMSSP